MITHLTYAKTSMLCRILGRHHFKLHFTDRTPTRIIEYSECRFCKTRTAKITGDYCVAGMHIQWLRHDAP